MRIFSFITLFVFFSSIKVTFSQTLLIDPAGDGGFETGSTFAANGWTVVNGSASYGWFLGTATQPAGGGARTAYVSNNSGTANAYTLTTSNTSHFYRSVTVPAGATSVNLSFILKSVGETSNWDQLIVSRGTAAITSASPTAQVTAPASYTNLFSYTNVATYSSYATVTVNNIAGVAGATFNLVFTWKNDNSGGANPPAAVDNISLSYVPAVPLPTLSNTSSVTGVQTMFSGCRSVSTAPTFSLSLSSSGNTVQLELNTKSDFTGTSYTQTFSGTYSASTVYDFACTSLSPALPSSDETYFVRARGSGNAGSTWSSWTSTLWPYSVKTNSNANEPVGWHCSAQSHFDAGTLLTNNYSNFLASSDNSTSSSAADDYMQLGIGSSDNSLTAAGDQALTEGTSFYSGSGNNCITVGYYTASGSVQDYHGFRIQSIDIPQAAAIQSATFTCYAHTGSGCGGSTNTTNAMTLRLRGVDQDNCSAWANSTNTGTGDPKNRVRTTAGVNWSVPSGASQQWSTGLLISTIPDVTAIIQPIIDRAGFAAGNALGIIVDHNTSAGAYWRYFATMSASATYKARLQTVFDNFIMIFNYLQ